MGVRGLTLFGRLNSSLERALLSAGISSHRPGRNRAHLGPECTDVVARWRVGQGRAAGLGREAATGAVWGLAISMFDLLVVLMLLVICSTKSEQQLYTFGFPDEPAFIRNNNLWRASHRNYSHSWDVRKSFRRTANHPACPAPQGEAQGRGIDVVLFRLHTTTPARFMRLQTAVRALLKSNFEVHAHVDTTYRSSPVISLLERQFRSEEIQIHKFNDSMLFSTYKHLASLHQHLPAFFFDDDRPSWARLFHLEANNLWWSSVRKRKPYRHVWVVEDDVGVAGGSLADFLQRSLFRASKADLITFGAFYTIYSEPERFAWHRRWVYSDAVSEPFAKHIHERDQQYTHEHVQRFSSGVLDTYRSLLVRGYHGQSEMSSLTLIQALCPATPIFFFPRTLLGGNGTRYTVDGVISKKEWKVLNSDEDASMRLFHALKW